VLGVPRTLRIAWDPVAKQVTFRVDDAELTVDPQVAGSGTGWTVDAPRAWAGPANAPRAAIHAGVGIPGGAAAAGASGGMSVEVRNVFTDAASGP
jgi:hypothetical protein